VCGGCAWGRSPLAEQRRRKLDEVKALFPAARFADTPALGLRDRADLIWENGRLGLYALEGREVVDLPACPMMSPALSDWFAEFRRLVPPLRAKGSVRLRVSPQGERGVWLDFANQDVKTLFEEKTYLRALSGLAFVEIGQRRKTLTWREGAPKLTDPTLKPWFETYDRDMRPLPLFGPVGGFSQSGFIANRALVAAVADAAGTSGLDDWVELFCGNGNFALALAARDHRVEAIELDSLALAGLDISRREHQDWSLRVERADVYLQTGRLPALTGRGLLVDPPRAGMRQVLEHLAGAGASRPAALIYVSCFTDTFSREAARLRELGYRLRSLVGVDQFAHSPHAEWVALFTLG
jgi:23S rRNA (uracil1939-C5)-methyltransferase